MRHYYCTKTNFHWTSISSTHIFRGHSNENMIKQNKPTSIFNYPPLTSNKQWSLNTPKILRQTVPSCLSLYPVAPNYLSKMHEHSVASSPLPWQPRTGLFTLLQADHITSNLQTCQALLACQHAGHSSPKNPLLKRNAVHPRMPGPCSFHRGSSSSSLKANSATPSCLTAFAMWST